MKDGESTNASRWPKMHPRLNQTESCLLEQPPGCAALPLILLPSTFLVALFASGWVSDACKHRCVGHCDPFTVHFFPCLISRTFLLQWFPDPESYHHCASSLGAKSSIYGGSGQGGSYGSKGGWRTRIFLETKSVGLRDELQMNREDLECFFISVAKENWELFTPLEDEISCGRIPVYKRKE